MAIPYESKTKPIFFADYLFRRNRIERHTAVIGSERPPCGRTPEARRGRPRDVHRNWSSTTVNITRGQSMRTIHSHIYWIYIYTTPWNSSTVTLYGFLFVRNAHAKNGVRVHRESEIGTSPTGRNSREIDVYQSVATFFWRDGAQLYETQI